jgi:hypothetical protein
MKHLALLALILAAPAFADVPPLALPTIVEATGAVFVFVACGTPVAFELIENGNWHIRVAGDPDFLPAVKAARAVEAAGGWVVFVELHENTGCGLRTPLPPPPKANL